MPATAAARRVPNTLSRSASGSAKTGTPAAARAATMRAATTGRPGSAGTATPHTSRSRAMSTSVTSPPGGSRTSVRPSEPPEVMVKPRG
jgi:hypothetical protein